MLEIHSIRIRNFSEKEKKLKPEKTIGNSYKLLKNLCPAYIKSPLKSIKEITFPNCTKV